MLLSEHVKMKSHVQLVNSPTSRAQKSYCLNSHCARTSNAQNLRVLEFSKLTDICYVETNVSIETKLQHLEMGREINSRLLPIPSASAIV